MRQQRRLRLADAFDDKTAATSRPALEAVLADATEAPSLRGAAAKLLARRFKREATPTLRAALKATRDSLLRSDIIEGLGASGAREAAGDLVPLLADGSLWVRQAAALTLASLGDARGLSTLEAMVSRPETSGLVQPHLLLGQLAMRRKDLTTAGRPVRRPGPDAARPGAAGAGVALRPAATLLPIQTPGMVSANGRFIHC